MRDELRTVLRLVAEGHLSPDEAAPIIEALGVDAGGGAATEPVLDREPRGASAPGLSGSQPRRGEAPPGQGVRARHLRIRVTERGRQVVNLRIPLGFAGRALRMVPGIGEQESDRIRAAIESGAIGPIVDVEDASGDGVLISID